MIGGQGKVDLNLKLKVDFTTQGNALKSILSAAPLDSLEGHSEPCITLRLLDSNPKLTFPSVNKSLAKSMLDLHFHTQPNGSKFGNRGNIMKFVYQVPLTLSCS
jgi:hypothetical protein